MKHFGSGHALGERRPGEAVRAGEELQTAKKRRVRGHGGGENKTRKGNLLREKERWFEEKGGAHTSRGQRAPQIRRLLKVLEKRGSKNREKI